jgi:membrane protease YdiL (CAAX protease family)
MSLALPGGLTVFMVAFGQTPGAERFAAVLPLAPWVLLFAAMNAYGEELTYRAALLSGLEPAVGPRQALLISAVFFGLMHYYGVPYGVLGVVMSGGVGWLMGKAMLETRGFFWAWCIHTCLDIAAFTFIAMGTVIPGG